MGANTAIRHAEYYRGLGNYALVGIIPSIAATFTASAVLHIFKQLATKGAHLLGIKTLQERALVPLSLLPQVMTERAHILFITAFALSMLSARYLLGNPTTFYENRVLEALKDQKPVEDVLAAQKLCEDKGISFKANVDNLLLLLNYKEPRTDETRINLIKKLMPNEDVRKKAAFETLMFILGTKGNQAIDLEGYIPALVKLMEDSLDDDAKNNILSDLVTMSMHNPKADNNISKLTTFIKASKVDLNTPMTGQYGEGTTSLTFIGYYLLSAKKQGTLTDEKKELAKSLMLRLRSLGTNLSKKDEFSNKTLLDLAFDLAKQGEEFLLKELLSYPRINLNFHLKSGETALTHIILKAPELHRFIPEILKKTNSALLNLEDALGYTPLIAALEYGAASGDYRLMKQLLHKGVCPNIQNREGHTALHMALLKPTIETYPLGLLLNYGANIKISDRTGMSAENLMLQQENIELTTFMRYESRNRRTSGKGHKLVSTPISKEAHTPNSTDDIAIKEALEKAERAERTIKVREARATHFGFDL